MLYTSFHSIRYTDDASISFGNGVYAIRAGITGRRANINTVDGIEKNKIKKYILKNFFYPFDG